MHWLSRVNQYTHEHGTCCSAPCVQESPVANRIKEAFFSEKGLAGNVQRLPFDKLFSIDSVKKVCRHCERAWACSAQHNQQHLTDPLALFVAAAALLTTSNSSSDAEL